jgi:hypothetical protein
VTDSVSVMVDVVRGDVPTDERVVEGRLRAESRVTGDRRPDITPLG